jgi:hypothetical protein
MLAMGINNQAGLARLNKQLVEAGVPASVAQRTIEYFVKGGTGKIDKDTAAAMSKVVGILKVEARHKTISAIEQQIPTDSKADRSKMKVMDINGQPSTLAAEEEADRKWQAGQGPATRGDAAKLHANKSDFKYHTAGGPNGSAMSDDGITWFNETGDIIKGK